MFLVDALPSGSETTLTGDQARHASSALRMQAGEELVLTDGRGNASSATVDTGRSGRHPELSVSVRDHWYEQPPELRVVIAQALVKGERGELAVELATEAGADAIVPWQAARSVARWDDAARQSKGRSRWLATSQAAAKQARRMWVPDVQEPVYSSGLAGLLEHASGALVLDADACAGLHEVALPERGDLVVVVGPEGGISPDELQALTAAGARCVRLGPSVLRASTAAAVALGAIGAVTSRWAR